MKIAVGSTNPSKIQAVREAFYELFGEVQVRGIPVVSDVAAQPFHEEVMQGAVNRAEKAITVTGADFGVGIEGGIIQLGGRWYNLGFVAIIDKAGQLGTGTSGLFECPSTILEQVKRGKELGDVMDEVTGRKETEKEEGAIGIFTKGTVKRTDLYKHGVFMALVPFLTQGVF
jgi:inosine/xanthosine triphosphatase